MINNKTIIEAFLKENEFKYELDEKVESFTVEFQAENLLISPIILYDDNYVVVVAKIPLLVDSKKTKDIGELLFRINDTLISGAFDFNQDKRIISFRTGLNLIGLELTKELIENIFFNTIAIMDSYIKAISQVLTSDITPVEAIRQLETEGTK